jgi:hypothetical protein
MQSVPPEAVLRAATRWLQQLRGMSISRSQSFFASHPAYNDLTLTQYGLALRWLREIGFVTREGALSVSSSPAELALLQTVLMQARPVWLSDADRLILVPDDLPDDATSVGRALGLSPAETLAAVRTTWSKVDTAAREAVGAAGEIALFNLLANLPGVTVRHVAEYSDGFGYDIAVFGDGLRLNLEVKSTTRRGRLSVYLSRNEFEAMRADPSWRLIVVLIGPDQLAEAVGVIESAWVARHAPADSSPFARWESLRLDIPPGVVQRGVSEVCEWAGSQLSDQHVLKAGVGERPPAWITSVTTA